MPRIQLKHVVSFTSEDPKNPADNLLKPEDYFKWRCAIPGENKCVVELQFERATQIHSVDVGNNGSAFVEILVGRSSWDPSKEYKVLLAASSFMSPTESKSGTAAFRVRIFGSDKLNKPVAAERWDRAKIVCTQPYNKADCYGLSFVTFHSPPEHESDEEKNTATNTLNFKNKIGKFTLKEESDVDEIQVGSYFAKKLQHDKSLTSSLAAASARDASSSIRLNALASKTSSASSESILPSFKKVEHSASLKQKESLSSFSKQKLTTIASPDIKKQCISVMHSSDIKQVNVVEHSKKDEDSRKQIAKQEGSKRKFEDAKATTNIMEQEGERSAPPTKKVKRRSKHRKLPFHRIMRNVVFVLSGYKNPQRSNLRQQAISMGAQYRPDWEPGCTHLICAFKNTPKYTQVLGKGKIVSDKWISDCAKKHERLSIKQYRIDGGSSSSESGSSDSENAHSTDTSKPSIEVASKDAITTDTVRAKLEEPMPGPSRVAEELEDDEYDTEDELRRAREAISCSTKDDEGRNDEDDDEYGGSTEDESDNDRKDERVVLGSIKEQSKCEVVRPDLPPLPNYFNHERFLLYGDFDPIERRRLIRYITAYNGVICDYMNNNIKYVVSDKNWDRTFDEAAASNSLLEFIRPSWIIKCHEEGMRVSTNDFHIHQA